MANLNVSYTEMTSRADQLAAGREEINTTLQRLQSQINALVAQGFTTDQASGRFQEAVNRFTAGATNTIAGLDDLAGFLRSTAATLQDVDAQIAARIGR
ncbi:WXG100 family type VII secretion target [Microbacterium lacticum]|uniref:WXG100 family type VII secretion target n=1 Tax=Microbacterium lacticum TaxID=33885 RepID=UPI0018B0A271|nr:WXG100 family type VII secretion target [Microbacterium lacticum]MBF9336634.1 WXG100 family type VII secretion target [Microbacterium lacticum]